MSDFASPSRLNPSHWPDWSSKLDKEKYTDIWFITGRRSVADICPDMPVVVLGTNNLGVVAVGMTSSNVEFCSDPDWEESPPEHQLEGKESKNRVCVKIKRVDVTLRAVQDCPSIAILYRTARETTTWLTEEQYQDFFDLIERA